MAFYRLELEVSTSIVIEADDKEEAEIKVFDDENLADVLAADLQIISVSELDGEQ